MPIESNTAYTKALIVFAALVACSSTSVATTTTATASATAIATPIHVDAVRISGALDALNASLAVQRFLKSDVDNNAEERDALELLKASKSITKVDDIAGKIATEDLQLAEKIANYRTNSDTIAHVKPSEIEGGNIFKMKNFNTWVEKLREDSPEKVPQEVFSSFEKHMTPAELTRLFTVNVPKNSKRLAENVLKVQVESWVKGSKTDEQVLELLGLEKTTGDVLLRDPAFPQWVSFVIKRHSDSPEEAAESMYLFLSSRFEGTWEKLLAETPVDTNIAVERLQNIQRTKWFEDNKTPEQVLDALKLGDTKGELLSQSPAFPQWVSYFMEYQKKSPEEATEWLSLFLSSRFKGKWDVLLTNPSANVENVARPLLNSQLTKWHNDKIPPEDVFQFMGLTKDTELLKSPSGQTWLEYVHKFKNENDFDTLKTLQEIFGKPAVAKMLFKPKNALAEKVQEAQFRSWDAKETGVKEMDSAIRTESGLKVSIAKSFTDWRAAKNGLRV